LAFYTIGQRKGLGISSAKPLYVLAKDTKSNTLIVGHQEELGKSELIAVETNWISGHPPEKPLRANVKIRYKAHDAKAVVTPLDGRRAHVQFEQPARDITPGQAAVFYRGEMCLGGGTITNQRNFKSWSSERIMTTPALILGFIISTMIALAVHILRGGGAGRLLLYLILAWAGFWLGQLIAARFGWTFGSVGPLHLGMASICSLLVLGVGQWLSQVDTGKQSE
jgi:hypothetical protein